MPAEPTLTTANQVKSVTVKGWDRAKKKAISVKVSLDDKPFGDYPVVALEAVPVAGIFGRMIDTVRLWFN